MIINNKQEYKHKIISLALSIIVFLTLVSLIFDFYYVKGLSMTPVINEKSLVVSNKIAYGIRLKNKNKYILNWIKPKENDKVIFRDPKTNNLAIKKIFAVPNERFLRTAYSEIEIRNIKFKVNEKILNKIKNNKIPENFYLVIGENKEISLDSRSYGFIHMNEILGKIIY